MFFDIPFVIGHRGARGHAPENTLASIRKAADLGCTWVEFDVKLTRDGVPVIFHDETLARTTGAPGKVRDRTWRELAGLDAGGGEPIPRLAEVTALLADLGLGANVEIKSCPGRGAETGTVVGEFLARHWPDALPPALLSSFSAKALAAAGRAAPALPRALLCRGLFPGWERRARALGCRSIHVGDRSLRRREQVEVVRSRGFALRAFTVNDAGRAARLRRWGVDGVFSDYPDRLAS